MEPLIRTLIDISDTAAARLAQADLKRERARWASQVFQRYDAARTRRIVEAVAEHACTRAAHYAERAVAETGFGVVAHKKLKNELTSRALVEYYRDTDFVSPRVREDLKMVELPRPAGVIFALAPSTNPIATINFKLLLALMTRNAIVVSPHPAARECCVEAIGELTRVAEQAGAPEGAIQVIERPTLPLIEEFMRSPKTDLILATGGTAMVRSAYSSSNPAIGVGPGNAPVFVDSSADADKAAQRIVESKSFDNSTLCTNESVLITLTTCERKLRGGLERAGAYFCDDEQRDALRRYLFHERGFNVEALGRDATWIAAEAGIRVPPKTRLLVAPMENLGVEEPLSREKLCPVLAYLVASSRSQAIAQARALLRLSGAGHTAAIHATDESTILEFAAAMEAYRIVVNAPASQGAAGFATHLAPTFTIGTGFYGRSSVGENIGPQHLVHWTRIAYNDDPSEPMGSFSGLTLRHEGPLPEAPADGVPGSAPPRQRAPAPAAAAAGVIDDELRSELRRIIVEELRAALKR